MNNSEPILYQEQMDADELAFLERKDEKESGQFYKVMKVLMAVCFILPFILAWIKAFAGDNNPFSMLFYFIGVFVLLGLTFLGSYIAYRRGLYKVRQDVKHGQKTIERTHITRKQFMPHNNTYYFYLDSPNKLSIEVSQDDYHNWEKGDELNIEYSTNAKFYFGYY
ncbi:MAG: hypothetical protein H6551_06460 [Chitinophagales bacterium]|nr:hypothetical protein [Chitinophagaceae bacterium]MCB9064771.1 hypothetical protein [Chitinophagales bacterium]